MAVTQGHTISATKRFWNIINNGLLLLGIRNRLVRIGINVLPYYWVQEEYTPCNEPPIICNPEDFKVKYLTKEEVGLIASKVPKRLGNELIKGFKNGQLCVGLKNNNTIAAYTFIELNDFTYNKRLFKLKDNEAYLLNMWTFHEYRGKNLAPYLRYKSYQLLREKGKDVKYSITNYFNKSSIKFKRKLNSKHLTLYLSIVLFKKIHWNFKLKDYN
ncbi:MAG: hypothetical protein HKO81_00420 [Flavobacteriaceae bacterium]|nr:hypothetical protein [Flavobacteriaceae bacterium]